MRTIPLLPCASIDEITTTSASGHISPGTAQPVHVPGPRRPGAALLRLSGFLPEDSYGSCVVIADRTLAYPSRADAFFSSDEHQNGGPGRPTAGLPLGFADLGQQSQQ